MESITAAAAATCVTPTTRQVICIARMLGAGGPHVGVRVAEELGYSYVDEDIVHQAAASGGVSVEELDDVARRKSLIERAASYALAGRDDVLRVLVTASPATRRARTAAAAALCERRASEAVAEDDAGRAAYLRDFYNIVDEGPTHYDLTLNSDTLSIETMAQLVVRAASAP